MLVRCNCSFKREVGYGAYRFHPPEPATVAPHEYQGSGGRVSGTRCTSGNTKSGFGLYTECDLLLHFKLLQHEVEILNGKLSKNSPKLLQNPICIIIMLSRISMTPSQQSLLLELQLRGQLRILRILFRILQTIYGYFRSFMDPSNPSAHSAEAIASAVVSAGRQQSNRNVDK